MAHPSSKFPFDVHSPTIRAAAIGVLVLLLQIPLVLITSLVQERQMRRDEVAAEIGEKWGRGQVVSGPWIEVPYEVDYEGYSESRVHRFLPHELSVDGEIDVQLRSRGIFSVPVYTSDLAVEGSFVVPEIEGASRVWWERARLLVAVDDPSSIQGSSTLVWDGDEHEFEPAGSTPGIEVAAPLTGQGAEHQFSFALQLDGSGLLSIVPVGEKSTIQLSSSWPHPSFQGSWLPDEHDISASGFTARWSVSALSRGFPTQWTQEASEMQQRLRQAAVGVQLGSSVDHYVMSARSTRYAILFFAAVFGVLWVLELRGGFRLHPIHYLLTGAALCSFHLLIVAFSEHLGFSVAYGLAAGMVTLLLIYYAHGALCSAMGAASVGGTCMGIYSYLYVCLANEDHALLFGAIGVFVGIAAVMVLTRRLAYVAPASTDLSAVTPPGAPLPPQGLPVDLHRGVEPTMPGPFEQPPGSGGAASPHTPGGPTGVHPPFRGE
jgi:inner membrane protein